MVVLFLGGVPFCLILAYGFHLVWERPFLERRSKKARENTEPGELICPPRLIPIAESNRAKL
jgi:hypothetical protein